MPRKYGADRFGRGGVRSIETVEENGLARSVENGMQVGCEKRIICHGEIIGGGSCRIG